MTLTLFCAFQPVLIFWCAMPRYSLAHRRVFALFLQSLEITKKLPVWQRLHHCLNHQDINENAGAMWCFFFFFFFTDSQWKIHIFIFTETMWMQSVGLTTGADSWADAWKVNCERLWNGTEKKAELQPLLLCSQTKTISSQEWKH